MNFQEVGWRACTGLILLRLGTRSGGTCGCGKETLSIIKWKRRGLLQQLRTYRSLKQNSGPWSYLVRRSLAHQHCLSCVKRFDSMSNVNHLLKCLVNSPTLRFAGRSIFRGIFPCLRDLYKSRNDVLQPETNAEKSVARTCTCLETTVETLDAFRIRSIRLTSFRTARGSINTGRHSFSLSRHTDMDETTRPKDGFCQALCVV